MNKRLLMILALLCAVAQGTKAYTISSGTDDMWLYFGDIDNGDESETLSELQLFENVIYPFDKGLLYKKKFYTGGTTEVTFTPVVTLDAKGANDVKANDEAQTANSDGSYTLTMNSQNVTVTATIEDLSYDALTLFDEPTSATNASAIETNVEKTMNVTLVVP